MTVWTERRITYWGDLISTLWSALTKWGSYNSQAITLWSEEDATQWKDCSYRLWSELSSFTWNTIPQNQ